MLIYDNLDVDHLLKKKIALSRLRDTTRREQELNTVCSKIVRGPGWSVASSIVSRMFFASAQKKKREKKESNQVDPRHPRIEWREEISKTFR